MRGKDVFTFVGVAAALGLPGQGRAAAKANVVLILMDNLGYGEPGCYGGGILRGAPTPRIDGLAAEGTRFLNFNVEAQCTPTRSALLTGRFAIRSGTHTVPIGGLPEGLTRWEITLAELFSGRGYATAHYGKWHLGSRDGRLPNDQGFDEWYGIPRSTDESMWPSRCKDFWDPEVAPPEYIMEGRKGEKSRNVKVYDEEQRRLIDAELTRRSVDFMRRQAEAGKPFFLYLPYTLVHMPALPNPAFAGKTGNGDWADCLAEMDHHVGRILDAVKELGLEEDTIVIFASDNGPEANFPWRGWGGPWRGTYFTAMEGSLRAPCIIRWPGRVPAGRVTNEIVHVVDLYTTLAGVAGAQVPTDRPVDGVDQLEFFLGKRENSSREGFPAFVSDRLQAVKWRNWKIHLYWQVEMYDVPEKLPLGRVFNLLTDPKEERSVAIPTSWVAYPAERIVTELEASFKKYPPIPPGTPDPYRP
jgi:arylsulfatase A-like enzyme